MKNIIIIVLSIFVLLLGFMWYKEYTKNTTKTVENMQKQDTAVGVIAQNIGEDYENRPEFQQCVSQAMESCLYRAVDQEVSLSGTADACDRFSDEELRENCKINHTLTQAVQSGDASSCDGLAENDKSSCVYQTHKNTAVKNRDLEFCNGLDTEDGRIGCVSWVAAQIAAETGDRIWCDKVPETRPAPDGGEMKNLEKQFCFDHLTKVTQ